MNPTPLTHRMPEAGRHPPLSPSRPVVGARAAPLAEGRTAEEGATARRLEVAAAEATGLGTIIPGTVGVEARDEAEDGGGGQMETPLMMTTGRKMGMTTTTLRQVEVAVEHLRQARRMPCWRSWRG